MFQGHTLGGSSARVCTLLSPFVFFFLTIFIYTTLKGSLLYWPFYGCSPGVVFSLCCFVVYSTRWFVLCLTLCHFVLVFFSPFGIAITSLGEGRAVLGAFRAFVRLCLFGFVGFLFLLGSWKDCGLWLWHSLDFSLTFFYYIKVGLKGVKTI